MSQRWDRNMQDATRLLVTVLLSVAAVCALWRMLKSIVADLARY